MTDTAPSFDPDPHEDVLYNILPGPEYRNRRKGSGLPKSIAPRPKPQPFPDEFHNLIQKVREDRKEKRKHAKKRGPSQTTILQRDIESLQHINALLTQEATAMSESKPAVSEREYQEERVRTVPLHIYEETPMFYHVGPLGLTDHQKANGGLTKIAAMMLDGKPPKPIPGTNLFTFVLPRWFANQKGLEIQS